MGLLAILLAERLAGHKSTSGMMDPLIFKWDHWPLALPACQEASQSVPGAEGRAQAHLWLCCARWSQPGSRAGIHPGSWAGSWGCWSWRSCHCWSSARGSPRWSLSSSGLGCCRKTKHRGTISQGHTQPRAADASHSDRGSCKGQGRPPQLEETRLRSPILGALQPQEKNKLPRGAFCSYFVKSGDH